MGTIVAALVLFSWERIPADVTALGILLFLIITGLLPPEEAFAGFGSDVFIMVMGLLILMEALSHTGVTDYVGQALLKRVNSGATQLLLIVMIAAVVIGGTSLSGGRGSVWGTVLGALIIGVLNSGLVIMGVDPFWQKVIKGFVILLAVVIDRFNSDE